MGTRHGCYVCLSASSRLTAATSCPVTGTVIGAAGIVGEGETPDAIVRRHSKRGAGSSCRSAVGRGPSRCSARRCAGSCVAAIAHPGDAPRACVVVAGVRASALVGLVDPDAMALAVVRLACSVTIRDSGASVAARWLLVAASGRRLPRRTRCRPSRGRPRRHGSIGGSATNRPFLATGEVFGWHSRPTGVAAVILLVTVAGGCFRASGSPPYVFWTSARSSRGRPSLGWPPLKKARPTMVRIGLCAQTAAGVGSPSYFTGNLAVP